MWAVVSPLKPTTPCRTTFKDRAAAVENGAMEEVDNGIFPPLLSSCRYRRA